MLLQERHIVMRMDYKSITVQKALLDREMKPLKQIIDDGQLTPEELYAKTTYYRILDEHLENCNDRIEELANEVSSDVVMKALFHD